MASKQGKPKITIALTPDQQELVRQSTGKGTVAPELAPEELEERVAPTGPPLYGDGTIKDDGKVIIISGGRVLS